MFQVPSLSGALWRRPRLALWRPRSDARSEPLRWPADLLDDPLTYDALDRAGMRAHIASLDAQARAAWREGLDWAATHVDAGAPSRVILAGMGGSAIGADVVTTLASVDGTVPVHVVRSDTAPPLTAGALVIVCSVSGETEETLAVFRQALASSCRVIAITTGGTLARLAADAGVPVFTYRAAGPPRATFGYGVFALLAILSRMGVLSAMSRDVDATLAGLRDDATTYDATVPFAENRAKQIAARVSGGIPVVIGTDLLAVAARRWAAQANENAKQWAFHAALPEVNHNLIVGFSTPRASARSLRAVVLDAGTVSPRNRQRARLMLGELQSAGVPAELVTAPGDSALEAIVRGSYLGDWVSLYLAMLNGVDPTPVAPIDRLKAALAGSAGVAGVAGAALT